MSRAGCTLLPRSPRPPASTPPLCRDSLATILDSVSPGLHRGVNALAWPRLGIDLHSLHGVLANPLDVPSTPVCAGCRHRRRHRHRHSPPPLRTRENGYPLVALVGFSAKSRRRNLRKNTGRVPARNRKWTTAARERGRMSANAFCTRLAPSTRNARRLKFRPGKMRKNYDLCGTCRKSSGSCFLRALSQSRHIKTAQKNFTYGERTRRVLPMLKVKARASALFYSHLDHHRKSAEAEIWFVYWISGIGEIGENAISLPRVRAALRSARLTSFSILREIGYVNEEGSAITYGN